MAALNITDTLNRPSWLDWAVAAAPRPGETDSGDRHMVLPFSQGALAAVVDGLGHGPEAATAAKLAVETLEQYRGEPLSALVQTCHEALRRTRGVTLSATTFDVRDNSMQWLSVGDVEGVLLRADPRARPSKEHLMQRGGVVGYQMPTLRPATLSLGRDDTLVLATDGIRAGFADALFLDNTPRTIAERILANYGRQTDDALVLVIRYLGGAR